MQSARQIRFTNIKEIVELETIVKVYIYEAVEVEKAGLKVNYKKAQNLAFLMNSQKYWMKTPAWILLYTH